MTPTAHSWSKLAALAVLAAMLSLAGAGAGRPADGGEGGEIQDPRRLTSI